MNAPVANSGLQSIAHDYPALVAHADWGSSPHKRWIARASLQGHGYYYVYAPEPAGEPRTLIQRLHADAGPDGIVLLGFDFPIGIPLRYAEQAGIADFLAWLPHLGQGDWADFYTVAGHPAEISLHRPFYPRQPGQAKHSYLLDGLGVRSMNELRRQCDRARDGRRAASPLFWTLGGQQVGKAAISGWNEVLAPALRSRDIDVAVWPFSGRFFELFRPGRVVIAETYPAEFYIHLGVTFPRHGPGQKSGKRVQKDRTANAPRLLAWVEAAQVELDSLLRTAIQDGFGSSPDGDDRFDATVGLFGMLNVVLDYRLPGEPADDRVRKIEGWILGQSVV